MVGRDQEGTDPAANHAVPDEALGHSGQAWHPICFVMQSTSKLLAVLQARTEVRTYPQVMRHQSSMVASGACCRLQVCRRVHKS